MQEDLRQQILTNIERDYGLRRKGSTPYLRGGKCPACGKKELYTSYEKPWVLRCGRQGKCGAEYHVKDLYSDLFEDWSTRFKQTPESPTASADAYLQFSRGFDLAKLRGLYTQENYWNATLRAGSATVRFALAKGGWWERIIDRPQRFHKRKANFAPGQSFAGRWWQSPGTAARLADCTELWIVEGIFDAIALEHHDLAAVSAMSSNQFPEESLAELAKARAGHLPVLVWALDNEPAARAYVRKHIERAKKLGFRSRAALIPQPGRKVDWNDLHLRSLACHDADDAAKQWDGDVAEARYQGDLLLAKSAVEKGLLMHAHDERADFQLGFRNQLYWFDFDAQRYAKLLKETIETKGLDEDEVDDELRDKVRRAACTCKRIANCYPEALYFQRHDVTDESWYFFRVDFPHDSPSVKGTFTGGQVSSATEFKKRIISMAQGAVFTGSGYQLDRMMEDQLFNIKTVETIDYVGYAKEHKAWVLGDLAVREGQLFRANEEDYFEFGKLRLKSLSKSIRLDIQPDDDGYRTDWLQWLWTCFGTHGIVALAFWTGSLYAEQIRAQFKSFPFLEATGEAGAGKTTLLTFLWKLLGRSDYEGFDPSKSSVAGRSRAMGQISGMPVVMLEADRNTPDKAHAKAFDWDELKDFYGGGTLRTRGVKNGGNDTYEPPFRGTIVISQNAAVDASEAILTRIVKLHFKRPVVTTDSRQAADNLNALPVEAVSHYIVKACKAEPTFMETFGARVAVYETALRERRELRLERVIKNHAQMMALVDCLKLVLPIPDDMTRATIAQLADMAMERQEAINADHPAVAEFWEVYEYLENTSEKRVVNHSRTVDTIAINLNEFAAKAAQYGQKIEDLKLLRELLHNSTRHKFIAANVAVNSIIRAGDLGKPGIVKCWTFKASTPQAVPRLSAQAAGGE